MLVRHCTKTQLASVGEIRELHQVIVGLMVCNLYVIRTLVTTKLTQIFIILNRVITRKSSHSHLFDYYCTDSQRLFITGVIT